MVVINDYLCKNCGYCVKFCPKNVLEIGTQRNKRGHFYPVAKKPDACISCAVCAAMCPEGAIELPPKGDIDNG